MTTHNDIEKYRHFVAAILLALFPGFVWAAPGSDGVWTSVEAKDLPADFAFQGEYEGKIGEQKYGVQVISLGKGEFQAVFYPGGLPGDGWTKKDRSLLAGTMSGEIVNFSPADGKRRYLAAKSDEFSAVKNFPPSGKLPDYDKITGNTESIVVVQPSGQVSSLKRVSRKSPTLGKKPSKDAIVLFDGSNKDAWNGGRLDETTKLLNTDGKDIRTKQKFMNYKIHVEFMLPYRPDARGQGRGNSGFYQVDHYEVQILDSFGLEGVNNECGGVYTLANPDVNMCLPPLTWQTYDVEFTNAVADENGKKEKPARLTVYHNGVKIHDNIELKGRTGGSRNEPEGTPGVLKLQGHGNPLQFRNIWIVEK